MNTKLFEVLDRSTFIVVMATKLQPEEIDGHHLGCDWHRQERLLLGRVGIQRPYTCLALTKLVNGETHFEPFEWERSSPRTMIAAHRYILEKWDELKTGAVIDVEFILGETMEEKKSEVHL